MLAVVLIFLIVCPVGMIFAKAVMQNGRLDFSPAVQTLLNPENAHMIGNSLLLGVLVVPVSYTHLDVYKRQQFYEEAYQANVHSSLK